MVFGQTLAKLQMCGRYTLHTSPERLAEHFQVTPPVALASCFNIAPAQAVPVVRQGVASRELAMLHWGLVPCWAKAARTGYRLINARAETVAVKPAFRAAFRQRRCLIPADGFYEWQPGPKAKQPYYITFSDGGLFAFAGLWEHWEGEDSQQIESCTIVVTAANTLVQAIHERMPVILDTEDYTTWLDTGRFNAARLEALLKPYPAERMQAWPVSSRVNSPKNTDASCIAPCQNLHRSPQSF